MCGIYGFIKASRRSFHKDILRNMGLSLNHRGPDQSGKFVDDFIEMGIERLSILDIEKGNQPIFSNNKRYIIVHNGEIYNYQELRKKLEKLGFIFSTNTDTELIVNLYQYKKYKCLDDLNGMFVFAIYDSLKKEIFIGRDRYGIKPLYFFAKNKEFIFSSELKGILQHPAVESTISPDAIDLYLSMEYVPAPFSIFNDIEKLEQAHYLKFSNGVIKKMKWYELSYAPKITLKHENEYIDNLDNLISDSVKMRTLSDVPIGCFLSGGLDSSLITYYLTKSMDNTLKTFNISFEDSSFDESKYASEIADYFGTNHNSEIFSSDKMIHILPNIWKMMDEPFADPSLLPTYLLTFFTNKQVKVALSGDGGDEVFAGYPTYLAHKIDKYIPEFSHSLIRFISNLFPVNFNNMSFDFKLNQFSKGLGYKNTLKHQYWLGSFNGYEKKKNYTENFKNSLADISNLNNILKNKINDSLFDNDWEMHLLQDFYFYLQDDMLVKIDRTSMANSLEVRVPFLDHNVVDFVAKIPKELKYKTLTSKYILKRLGNKYLPNHISNRSKKGFGIPIANWLCDILKEPMQDIIQNPNSFINSIFEKKYTSRLMQKHLDRKQNNRKLLWTLFVLENWHNNQKNITTFN